MRNFIGRNYSRTEHDDWILNIQPKLCATTEVVPIFKYNDQDIKCENPLTLVGWEIKMRYA